MALRSGTGREPPGGGRGHRRVPIRPGFPLSCAGEARLVGRSNNRLPSRMNRALSARGYGVSRRDRKDFPRSCPRSRKRRLIAGDSGDIVCFGRQAVDQEEAR